MPPHLPLSDPNSTLSAALGGSRCRGIGLLWLTLGLMMLFRPESLHLFLFENERYPLLVRLLNVIFGLLAVVQGVGFMRQRGLVPWVAPLFFSGVTLYLAAAASRHYNSGLMSGITLVLILITTVSLLACGRQPPPQTPPPLTPKESPDE